MIGKVRYLIIFLIAISYVNEVSYAQTNLYLNGRLSITNGSSVTVNADLINRTGGDVVFINGGELRIEGDITNNGGNVLFVNADGEVIVQGAGDQRINGIDQVEFNHLTLNKLTGQVVLDNPISIRSVLEFIAGRLFLNTHNVDLGTGGTIVGESDASNIYGFPGSVIATGRFLNTPSVMNDIAGMGLFIGSAHSYGQTNITRIHKVQESPGNGSIQLHFLFEPQFENTSTNDQVVIRYQQYQVGGLDEANFGVWKSINRGVVWEKYQDSADPVANTVSGAEVADITTNTIYTVTELDCNTLPPVQVGDPVQALCTGNSIRLDAGGTGLIYQWFKDGVLLDTETTEFLDVNTPGIYRVVGTTSNGCVAEDQVEIQEKALPVANFTVPPGCVLSNVNFTNTSTSLDGTMTFLWDFGDGITSTEVNPSHAYQTDGIFTVRLTATSTFGCENIFQDDVVIAPLPEAAFEVIEVCEGEATQFHDQSTVPAGFSIINYLWTFGDGNSSGDSSPQHTYATEGVYIAALRVISNAGCVDQITKNVIVREQPVADFSALPVCSTNVIEFTNQSTSTAELDFLWDFGNGETSLFESPTVTFEETGTFPVTLTITNPFGCQDVITRDVDILVPEPILSPEIITCGTSLTIDADPDGVFAGSDFLWSTQETMPSIEVTSNGVYTVMVTRSPSCQLIGSTFVRLNVPVVIELPDNIQGCDSETLDAGFFSGATYRWSTGETTRTIDVTSSDLYSIEVTDRNNCITSKTVNVTINESLVVDLGEDQFLCPGEEATLDAGNPGNNYLWSDGSTGQTLTTSISNEYWVEVTSPSTGCTTRDNVQVFIYDDFEVDLGPDRIVCKGSPVMIDAGMNDVTYEWSGPSGFSGNTLEVVAELPGRYWVTVTNSNGCQAADTLLLEESIETIEAFFLAGSLVDVGDTIQFINLSVPTPSAQVWDFGDNITSTDFEPTHTYLIEGSYDVNLTVTNGTCTNTLTKVITVRPLRRDADVGDEPFVLPKIVSLKVFPNPVERNLVLELEASRESNIYVDIVNLNGQVLLSSEWDKATEVQTTFNLSNVADGVYLLRAKVGKDVRMLRVMKK
ncbi:PKD domain-containing protein [Fulvivirga sp. M361]|uniref:PKD domain-containing protein n=1 Tax=Fulvivirga sp. M361 TaxID=2594266 RepID=UPI00117ADBEE|nr:PKD domain-containing protein [Fulvivirga sp. M361]TRX62715.1 PKD domain-containing protein [Fulvivirga sp. M361]